MHIGLIHTSNQFISGGIYQYTRSMIQSLGYANQSDHITVFCAAERAAEQIKVFVPSSWDVVVLDPNIFTRHEEINSFLSDDGYTIKTFGIQPRAKNYFERRQVDLLVFPTPASLTFESGMPYIMAIHDLQHRLQPQFPEVSGNGEWRSREYLFSNAVRYAEGILVDSEVGKEDVLNCYPGLIEPDRIQVLPFLPSIKPSEISIHADELIEFKKQYSLPDQFLFYPAQFWSHKNHSRLVHALYILEKKFDLKIDLVLTGSKDGPPTERRDLVFKNLFDLANLLNISDRIHYLGFVSDDDLQKLYLSADGLIFPTFFGPTNIPIPEAWAFGCPVMTSDIRGIREQIGDAGLLFSPTDAEDIANCIHRLYTDSKLREEIIKNGYQRIKQYTPLDFASNLLSIINRVRDSIEVRPQLLEWLGPVNCAFSRVYLPPDILNVKNATFFEKLTDHPLAICHTAWECEHSGNLVQAKIHYSKVRALMPDLLLATLGLARVLSKLGAYSEAERILTQALTTFGPLSILRIYLSDILWELKDLGQSIEITRQAFLTDYENLDLGITFHQRLLKANHTEAAAQFLKVLTENIHESPELDRYIQSLMPSTHNKNGPLHIKPGRSPEEIFTEIIDSDDLESTINLLKKEFSPDLLTYVQGVLEKTIQDGGDDEIIGGLQILVELIEETIQARPLPPNPTLPSQDTVNELSQIYNESFYAEQRDASYRSAEELVPILMEVLAPKSVVDIGCGVGGWLHVFSKHGVNHINGYDVNTLPENQYLINRQKIHTNTDFSSQEFIISQRPDLLICLEVAEHLPTNVSEKFVGKLTEASNVIVFSAAMPGQTGVNHVNEQAPWFWRTIFARFGFVEIDFIRPQILQNQNICWWYRQNITCFVQKDYLASNPKLTELFQKTHVATVEEKLTVISEWVLYNIITGRHLNGLPDTDTFGVITRLNPDPKATLSIMDQPQKAPVHNQEPSSQESVRIAQDVFNQIIDADDVEESIASLKHLFSKELLEVILKHLLEVEAEQSDLGVALSTLFEIVHSEVYAVQNSTPVLVSAIVSAYKSEKFMRGLLEDLESQTIAPFMEIIVVDSNSPQHEGLIVREFQVNYGNITYIRTDFTETIYGAWNRGILASRGKYITNANTDDRHRPDAFEKLVNALESHPDVALVYPSSYVTDQPNLPFGQARVSAAFKMPAFDRDLLYQQCYIGPQPMWRRDLHERYGLFHPDYKSAGDYEFWLRIARNETFLLVDELLGLYYNNPGGMENSDKSLNRMEALAGLCRHWPHNRAFPELPLNFPPEAGVQLPPRFPLSPTNELMVLFNWESREHFEHITALVNQRQNLKLAVNVPPASEVPAALLGYQQLHPSISILRLEPDQIHNSSTLQSIAQPLCLILRSGWRPQSDEWLWWLENMIHTLDIPWVAIPLKAVPTNIHLSHGWPTRQYVPGMPTLPLVCAIVKPDALPAGIDVLTAHATDPVSIFPVEASSWEKPSKPDSSASPVGLHLALYRLGNLLHDEGDLMAALVLYSWLSRQAGEHAQASINDLVNDENRFHHT